jgi:hypothetical protein
VQPRVPSALQLIHEATHLERLARLAGPSAVKGDDLSTRTMGERTAFHQKKMVESEEKKRT